MLEENKGFIDKAHFETLCKQERFQTLIPDSRGLFQNIQSFLEFENKVWKLNLQSQVAASHKPLSLYTHSEKHF
jgi:hypothetical protein